MIYDVNVAAGTTAPMYVQVNTDDSDEVPDELVDDETVRWLGILHDEGLLSDPGLELRDVPGLYEANDGTLLGCKAAVHHHNRVDPEELLLAGMDQEERSLSPQPIRRRPSFGIDPRNILPPHAWRRLRFNLPHNIDIGLDSPQNGLGQRPYNSTQV